MKPSLKSRVQKRLADLGISAAEATRRGRLSRTQLYGILHEINRTIRTDTAVKLASALECDVGYLTGQQSEPRKLQNGNTPLTDEVRMARVVGDVAAGVWHESTAFGVYDPDLPPDFDAFPPVPLVPDPRYNGLAQFAVKVAGPSVNRVIPDGFFAVCVPYWEARTAAQDGDLVVVERIRGGLHEATIKRLRRSRSGWELVPESDDRRFQQPVALTDDLEHEKEDSDVTIEIKGLVIWKGAPV